jgi:hypothetical protein
VKSNGHFAGRLGRLEAQAKNTAPARDVRAELETMLVVALEYVPAERAEAVKRNFALLIAEERLDSGRLTQDEIAAVFGTAVSYAAVWMPRESIPVFCERLEGESGE